MFRVVTVNRPVRNFCASQLSGLNRAMLCLWHVVNSARDQVVGHSTRREQIRKLLEFRTSVSKWLRGPCEPGNYLRRFNARTSRKLKSSRMRNDNCVL
jgi:hypothetical protein